MYIFCLTCSFYIKIAEIYFTNNVFRKGERWGKKKLKFLSHLMHISPRFSYFSTMFNAGLGYNEQRTILLFSWEIQNSSKVCIDVYMRICMCMFLCLCHKYYQQKSFLSLAFFFFLFCWCSGSLVALYCFSRRTTMIILWHGTYHYCCWGRKEKKEKMCWSEWNMDEWMAVV